MLPRRRERFEDWLAAPVDARCADARYEVRRATAEDHPALFGLLDQVFDGRRSRALCDWLYRRNPEGPARSWITLERATGALVANETRWPWPFARGSEALRGEMIGDAAVIPRLQRQGVGDLRAPFRQSHPWYAQTTAISWPNERSRRAALKHGYGARLFGPLPRAVLPLSDRAVWGAARRPSRPLGLATRALLGAWQGAAGLGRRLATVRLARFDAAFDRVTATCMQRDEYWSPHASDFLNWRYLEHPLHAYAALAAARGDEPVGYAVLRVDAGAAILMELATPPGDPACRRTLLQAVRELAREAGCDRVEFFATRSWPHWRAMQRAGFVRRPSDWWVQARGPVERPIAAWQLLPGDTDVL